MGGPEDGSAGQWGGLAGTTRAPYLPLRYALGLEPRTVDPGRAGGGTAALPPGYSGPGTAPTAPPALMPPQVDPGQQAATFAREFYGSPAKPQLSEEERARAFEQFKQQHRQAFSGLDGGASGQPRPAGGGYGPPPPDRQQWQELAAALRGMPPGMTPRQYLTGLAVQGKGDPAEARRKYTMMAAQGLMDPSMAQQMIEAAERSPGMDPAKAKQLIALSESQGGLQMQGHQIAAEHEQTQADTRRRELAIEAQHAEARRGAYQQQIEQSKADQAFAQERQAAYSRSYEARLRQYDQTIAEVRNTKIDPNRASSPVTDAIAMALGAVASGLLKQPNAAMQIINARIDRDIDAQKAELAAKTTAADLQANALGMLRAKFGDDQQAEAALRMMRYEEASNVLEANASWATSATRKAQVAGLREEMELAKQAQGNQLDLFARQMADADAARHSAMMVATLNAQQRAQRQQQLGLAGQIGQPSQQSGGQWQAFSPEVQKRYVPGLGLLADPEERREVVGILSTQRALKTNIDEYRRLAADPAARVPGSEANKRAGVLRSDIELTMKNLHQLGAISESDAVYLGRQVPGIDEIATMNAGAQLDTLLGTIDTRVRSRLDQSSAIPVQTGTVADKDGNPVPGYSYVAPAAQQRPQGGQRLDLQER